MNSGKIVAGGRDGWTSKVLQEVLADLKNREEEMAMGLEYEVGTIGTDIIMLQEDIKMVS